LSRFNSFEHIAKARTGLEAGIDQVAAGKKTRGPKLLLAELLLFYPNEMVTVGVLVACQAACVEPFPVSRLTDGCVFLAVLLCILQVMTHPCNTMLQFCPRAQFHHRNIGCA